MLLRQSSSTLSKSSSTSTSSVPNIADSSLSFHDINPLLNSFFFAQLFSKSLTTKFLKKLTFSPTVLHASLSLLPVNTKLIAAFTLLINSCVLMSACSFSLLILLPILFSYDYNFIYLLSQELPLYL